MSRLYTASLSCFALSLTLSAGCGGNPCDPTSSSFSPTECAGPMPMPMPDPMPMPMPMPMPAAKPMGTIVIGPTATAGLHVLSIENPSAKTTLTNPPADHSDGQPAYSPDGTQIVFVRNGSDVLAGQSLRIIKSDGTGETQLATCVSPSQGVGACEKPVIGNDGNVYYFDSYLALDGSRGRTLKSVPKAGGTSTDIMPGFGSCGVGTFVRDRAGGKLLLRLTGDACSQSGVYTFAANGSAPATPVRPTDLNQDLLSYSGPVFNLAGDKLVFPGIDSLNNVYTDRLYEMNEDGTLFAPKFDLPMRSGSRGNLRLTSDGKFLLAESSGGIFSIATASSGPQADVAGIEGVSTFDVKP